jgi:histidinol-phosphate aminotransferase
MSLPVPVRKAVQEMRPYHPPLEGRGGKTRLDFNENPAGCPQEVRKALARLSADEIAMYPEQETVRRELARFFGVSAEELLLASGTDESLHLIVNTFVEPGDAVLLAEPTFAMYRFYAELGGARIRALRYDGEMKFPVEQTVRELKKHPRLLFVANPNNPTGSLVKREELAAILRAASRTMVVVDEAYFEYSGQTALTWIRRHKNLIVTRTFSKAAGLAGLRLGCLFAHREVGAYLRKAQSPYPVNVAALAAARALARERRFLERTLEEFRRSREELVRGLARLGLRQFPSAANFILVDAGERTTRIVKGLARRKILIRDRSHDFAGAGYVRITIGTVRQTRAVLGALRGLL